jgi:hypothetical protein
VTVEALRTDLPYVKGVADRQWKHARGCKKVLEECLTCKHAIDFFAGLPLVTLSRVLEQTQPPPLMFRGREEKP